MTVLERVESVCPTCYFEGKIQKIHADIVEEDGKIWLVKHCSTHGSFKELYFNDQKLYERWMKYKVTGNVVSDVKTGLFNDLPLYPEHRSQTILTNLVVTNRCNVRCSSGSMNSGDITYIYEPSLDDLKKLMLQTRQQKPMGSTRLQISGGEPTIREDIFDIVRLAKQVGFSHVQIQTNGLKCSDSVEFCHQLKKVNVDTIYLDFNGIDTQANPLIDHQKKAIENLRTASIPLVLAPVVSNQNIAQCGKIVRFALDNIDIMKGVHFQPISFCDEAGKVQDDMSGIQRVDYLRIIEAIEQEFTGLISRDDFFPLSISSSLVRFFEDFTQEPQVVFTLHPGCGASTLLTINEGKPVPINRFFHIESFMEYFNELSKKKGPLRIFQISTSLVNNIDRFIDHEHTPPGFDLKQMVRDASLIGSDYALRLIHHKNLFIGIMWYQDPWTMNIDRLQRCVIHTTTFEGIVPFCMYTGLGYGERIQRRYSISVKEWEKKTGRKLKDDLREDIPLS